MKQSLILVFLLSTLTAISQPDTICIKNNDTVKLAVAFKWGEGTTQHIDVPAQGSSIIRINPAPTESKCPYCASLMITSTRGIFIDDLHTLMGKEKQTLVISWKADQEAYRIYLRIWRPEDLTSTRGDRGKEDLL